MSISFNSEKHILGTLCSKGHEWQDSGKSLRYRKKNGQPGNCAECVRLHRVGKPFSANQTFLTVLNLVPFFPCKTELPKRFNAFFSSLDVLSEDDCWEWTGAKVGELGYGKCTWDDRSLRSHRVAWMLANQEDIPEGLFVCHKCDNPVCCNPNHLFLGTHQDNMDDRTAKGRGADREKMAKTKKSQIRRKYSPEQVAEFKAMIDSGMNGNQMRVRFKLNHDNYRRIKDGTYFLETP